MLNQDGTYSCSNDLSGEISLYNEVETGVQESTDLARRVNPDWSETRLHEYVDQSTLGQVLHKIEDCVASHGYDVSTLPHVAVPFFPGEARGLVMLTIGAPIVYKKLKDWKSENPSSSYRDLVKSGYKGIFKIIDKMRGTGSSYI